MFAQPADSRDLIVLSNLEDVASKVKEVAFDFCAAQYLKALL